MAESWPVRHADHGTRSRYIAGCRCLPCRKANATYFREWRRNTGRSGDRPGGITTDPKPAVGDWADDAACRAAIAAGTHRQDQWFPERGATKSSPPLAAALAICADCPVRTECLEHALDTYEKHGVWGGQTERERRMMRRDRP